MSVETSANNPSLPAFGLTHDAWGRLILIDAEGHRYVGAEPVRAFPLTEPNRSISIIDTEGHEILWIENLEDLPLSVRQPLSDELASREFVPVIRRILKVSAENSPAEWQVETDRGPVDFTLDSEDDIRRIGPHRVLITDAKRMRYQILDTRALDLQGRRILERYL